METLLTVRLPRNACIRLRTIAAVTGLLQRDIVVTAFMCYHDRLPGSVRRRVRRALELQRKSNS
ncbi:MAG TPA: hypothetical protein VGJ39_02085 [Vicinamibacterales bacterium]|jgi:hypothetical protein